MTDPINQLLISSAGTSANNFLDKVGGTLIGDAVGYSNFGIKIKLRALKNQINAIESVRKICEETKFPIKNVNFKVLFS